MLQLDDVTVNYGSWSPIRDLSITFEGNLCVGIIGANGVGKTTLLSAIAGLTPVAKGRIVFDGTEWNGLSVRKRVRSGLSFVPDSRGLHPLLSVKDNLRLAPGELDEKFRDEIFRQLPSLNDRLRVTASALSGGEQQAVALIRAFRSNARVVLLDEPTLGLAPDTASRLKSAIANRTNRDQMVIVAEQSIAFCRELCDRIYLMTSGGSLRLLSDNEVLNVDEFLNVG